MLWSVSEVGKRYMLKQIFAENRHDRPSALQILQLPQTEAPNAQTVHMLTVDGLRGDWQHKAQTATDGEPIDWSLDGDSICNAVV
jgi:hypothetical protein